MREYVVDTSEGVVRLPMAWVGTHADRSAVDSPFMAPAIFHGHLPSPWIWSLKLVEYDGTAPTCETYDRLRSIIEAKAKFYEEQRRETLSYPEDQHLLGKIRACYEILAQVRIMERQGR